MSTKEGTDQTKSYESAAKDIEQEKKMVATLKRLSISNMMSYDPDLPMEDMEYQYQYQQQNGEASKKSSPTSPQMRKTSSLSRKPSLKSRPSPSEEPENHVFTEERTPETPQQEQMLETDTLLWVPANMHPEVDPEQFKIHVKTTVGEIMERKLSRKNSLSRQSSLSSSFLADEKHEPTLSEPETPENKNSNDENLETEQHSYQEKRFSNPSLRDLSFELENLSRVAGMDSTDAVTIARTLSSSSLGYTDVEKQAFDELSSPPHTSPNNSSRRRETDPSQNRSFVDPESPTSHKTVNRSSEEHSRNNSKKDQQPSHNPQSQQQQQLQQQQQQPHNMFKSPFNANDFSLKRSRRLDYRKLSNPSATPGSNLQSNKAGKLTELRNNLNSRSPSQVTNQYLTTQPQHKSKSKQRNARDSQLLFSYRNPNVTPNSQPTNDSPYPTSASSSSPIEQQFNTHRFSQHNLTAKRISHIKTHKDQYDLRQQQGYQMSTSRSSSGGSGNNSMQSFEEKVRPRQSPPSQPFPSRTTNKHNIPLSASRNQYRQHNGNHHNRSHGQTPNDTQPRTPPHSKKHIFQVQIPKSGSNDQNVGSQYQKVEIPKPKEIPQIKNSKNSTDQITDDKSKQLNQNLDLLRSEINEFKESLTKMDSPVSSGSVSDNEVPESSDNNESDFSFETSYQNISYEDSLGIEKDVLKELNNEKSTKLDVANSDLENKECNPFIRPVEETPSQALDAEWQNEKSKETGEDFFDARDLQVNVQGQANNDAIELSEIDEAPLVDEVSIVHEESDKSEKKYVEATSQLSNKGQVQKKKSFGLLPNHSASSLNLDSSGPKKSLKKKKSWPWLKERSASFSSSDGNKLPSLPEAKSPSRSFSTPETPTKNRQEQHKMHKEIPKAHDIKPTGPIGKENMISKFFKKKRSNSAASSSSDITSMDPKPAQDAGVTIDYDLDSEVKKNIQGKLKGGIFKKMNKNKQHDREKEREKLQSLKSTSVTSLISLSDRQISMEDYCESDVSHEIKNDSIHDSTRRSRIISSNESVIGEQLKNEVLIEHIMEDHEDFTGNHGEEREKEKDMTKPGTKSKLLESRKDRARRKSVQTKADKPNHEKEEAVSMRTVDDPKQDEPMPAEEKVISRSAFDIQEKLKKSIKRTSKANQPIEFTDSAFGFPLPPPSQSTLVMLDYRFPVHVERAIYRLSHLKLANPKRSLREQVLLSNFMYAYLNLVDHTLHLEQLNYSSENTPAVVDETKELTFAIDETIENPDELETVAKNEHDSEKIDIDLDIVDLSNKLTTKVEAQ